MNVPCACDETRPLTIAKTCSHAVSAHAVDFETKLETSRGVHWQRWTPPPPPPPPMYAPDVSRYRYTPIILSNTVHELLCTSLLEENQPAQCVRLLLFRTVKENSQTIVNYHSATGEFNFQVICLSTNSAWITKWLRWNVGFCLRSWNDTCRANRTCITFTSAVCDVYACIQICVF